MENFKNRWLGKVVDTDNYPQGWVYQCVDLVKQYLREVFNVPYGAYGDAINYWNRTHPNILAKFDRVQTQDVRAGDIAVLNGLKGNPYGHVGVATGRVEGGNFEMLEQNGSTGNGLGQGGDRIRTRMIPKSRLAGVLRPKAATPPAGGGQGQSTPTTGNTLFLPASAGRWRVYPLGVVPRIGNEKGFIRPDLFGGLTYKIVQRIGQNVAIIDTRDFGRVQIWIGRDTPAVVK